MFDDICLHVAQLNTSSPDSPFSLISFLTLSKPSSLRRISILIAFLLTYCSPLFTPHAHTPSTFFPGYSLRFPPLSFSSYVTMHIHSSCRMSATSNYFSSAFFGALVSLFLAEAMQTLNITVSMFTQQVPRLPYSWRQSFHVLLEAPVCPTRVCYSFWGESFSLLLNCGKCGAR